MGLCQSIGQISLRLSYGHKAESLTNQSTRMKQNSIAALVIVISVVGAVLFGYFVFYAPTHALSVSFTVTCCANFDQEASFTSHVSGGTPSYSYYWTFGDGYSSAQANPVHAYYSNQITVTVTLTISDSKGLSGSNSGTYVL